MAGNEEQLLAVLREIRDLLREQQQAQRIGFGDAPSPQYVFCNRSHGCNWYTLDGAGNPVPIQAEALTGRLADVSFERTVRRKQETTKLRLVIWAGREYRLEAGATTWFSRSLLASMAEYGPGELKHRLITIQPVPAQEETVLFCRLYVDGQPAPRGDWPPETDNNAWREIARKALAAAGIRLE